MVRLLCCSVGAVWKVMEVVKPSLWGSQKTTPQRREEEKERGGREDDLKKWLLVWSDSWGNTRLLYGEAW